MTHLVILKNVENKTKKWFDKRYQLKEIIEENVTNKLIPRGLSWFGCMGGLALVAFMIQVGTGIFLIFYFVPSLGEAFNSVKYIRHAVPSGWLIQKIHAVTPHFMITLVFAHMLRILFKGIYKKPRELHWVSGASLLVLTLILCYTGSLLPANDLSYWSINAVGNEVGMSAMATGYDEGVVSSRGFNAIYALHIACIPLLMCVIMGFHFLMVRRTGISEPL